MFLKSCLLISLVFFLSPTFADINRVSSDAAHTVFHEEPTTLEVDEQPLLGNSDRLLQTGTTTYPKIRIDTDFALLLEGTTAFKDYVKNELMPPIIAYFEAALAVKQPLTSALRVAASTASVCGYTTPKALLTGVNTDLFLMVISTTDAASNWVASAGACYLATGTMRPIIARMLFNLAYTLPANGDILLHEQNMYLTIHELMHALGFTGSSFKYFIDANGKTLTNHIKTVNLNGALRTVLDVEPLTSKLRKHYGCSTLEGAYMENDGGSGTEGSHFERRFFLYEVMTSGVIDGYRVSEFSLALLEGSGWYVPDYKYAEPFSFGQGAGCGFIYQTCSSAIYNFAEFCSVASRGCTAAGRGGGTCASDSRSDGCYYMFPQNDYDCDNSEAVDNARFPTLESYGRGSNSKCFAGTLTTLSKSSQTSFCFKYNCVGTGLNTVVQVFLGNNYITCKAEGKISISGYNGVLNCPDPLTFCNTSGKKYCPLNCMGRGTCVNNQCVCNTGFTGIDCALKK